MKKFLKYLLLITVLVIPTTKLKAATGVFDIYASEKSVAVGNTTTVTVYCKSDEAAKGCEYTLSYDSNKLKFLGPNDTVNCNGLFCVYTTTEASTSKSFSFKVIASGTSTVSVTSYSMYKMSDYSAIDCTVDPVSINGYIPSSSGGSSSGSSGGSTAPTYSTNNNLSSLKIEGHTISPEFNKDKTSYNLEVDANIEKINITATPEDSKSKIAGTGEKNITEGNNKFDIIVTSEKGTTKTYTVNVNMTDKNPIKVTINKETYTVMKRLTIDKPTACNENKAIINGIEIPSYFCENINYNLVGLKDKDGNSNLYIYDSKNNTYTLYQEMMFSALTIGVLDINEKLTGYSETTIKIDGRSINCLKNNSNSKYCLIYGINIDTGKKNWYMYEETENTIQKLNLNEIKQTSKKIENAKTIIYGLSGIIVLLIIILIAVASSKTPKKKVKKEEKPVEVAKEELPKEKKKKQNKHDIFNDL